MKEKCHGLAGLPGANAARSRELYREVRDEAWRMLLKHRVRSLPVDVLEICRREEIRVVSYRKAREAGILALFEDACAGNDGFALVLRGKRLIFYDDALPIGRQRFTIGHELGHFVLGDVGCSPTARNHEPSEDDSEPEKLANMFAARLLSPACVLWGLEVRSPEQVAVLCGLSRTASEWRFKRLMELYARERDWLVRYGRSCFLVSPLEAKVHSRFRRFIKNRNYRSD